MENKIKQFVMDIIQNPLLNVCEHASSVFGYNVLPTNSETNLVIPELAEPLPIKRTLVKLVILQKTKYQVAITKDGFIDNTVVLVDKTGASDK